MYNFSEQEIKIANATSRCNGASARNSDGSIRAVVPRYVAENISKDLSVLDFGAGKGAQCTVWLRELGFNCTAYDFGTNCIEGLHDRNALSKKYNVVFASNVINVSSSMQMLTETLQQIYNSVKGGGEIILNYPGSPRKLEMSTKEMQNTIESILSCKVVRVACTSSTPVWKICKPFEN